MRCTYLKRRSQSEKGTLLSQILNQGADVGHFTLYTVDVVNFSGGKFRENVGETFHVGVIFTKLLLFP